MLVITGVPGVGKSTVAAALAATQPRTAHVKADALQRMLVSGGEWPSAGTPEAMRQLLLRTRNAAQLAANFVDAGFDAILDEVISSPEQLALVDDTITAPTQWVVLTASPATILSRDASRSKHTAANYVHLDARIRQLLADRATCLDTTNLSIDETVDVVRGLLRDSGAS
jgi:predicted kinase